MPISSNLKNLLAPQLLLVANNQVASLVEASLRFAQLEGAQAGVVALAWARWSMVMVGQANLGNCVSGQLIKTLHKVSRQCWHLRHDGGRV